MKKSVFAVFIVLLALLAAPLAAAYGVTFYNPAWNPQDGIIFDVIEQDTEYTFNVRIEDISVTKIVFTVDREATNGGLTVYHLMSLPKLLPEVDENTTYEVDEIKYVGFVPHEMGDVLYEFKVAKSWLESNSVPRNYIILHYYDSTTETWEPLDTEIVDETPDFVYFKAEYTGVHYLMIGKSDSEEITASLSEELSVDEVEAEPEPVKEEPKAVSVIDATAAEVLDVASDVETVDLEKPVALPVTISEPVEVRAEPALPVVAPAADVTVNKTSHFAGVLILAALAVLIFILYIIFGDKRVGNSVDSELHNYIRESLKRGKSKDDVRQRLLEVGWHTDRVDKALSKHKEVKHAIHHPHHAADAHHKVKKK
ncbi:MAG: PGF-pre-PGF domain-containing protein [Candidatus Woesearchaeota archaeon]